ncbi:hypothetical protein [uncultured Oscillibacter sp.]|uniref:hypothetical protein n=1 Tax=uncultured Oscillibacter sp. TaxID=876091 RepID=UPI001F99439B|nr:hypothetical protein [uncultured Oscillibacter sp.]HJB31681.1 hypothetical protein [Candidatus Oscillibacter excrementavium]
MKAERLFRILGLVDESLIEEAVSASSPAAVQRRRHPWRRLLAAAACLAVICGGAYLAGTLRMGGRAGAGGSGHSEASTFMSYAGPVFPLTTAEETSSITAERNITLDFAPWIPAWLSNEEMLADRTWLTEAERQEALAQYDELYPEGGRWRSSDDILVTDAYTLANPSQEDQTVTLLYPFATSLNDLGRLTPTLTLDGSELETALHVGAYSGGFEGVWDGTIVGDPEGSVNLDYADSWEDYKNLLSDGTYLANALGVGPDVSGIPVTVYKFTDPYGPLKDEEAGVPNPSLQVGFDLDYSRTAVLTWGFDSGNFDRENGTMIQGFSIPQPGELGYGEDVYCLLVLGEDIQNMTTGGYVTGGADPDTEPLEGCGVTVERYESDLDTMLREILAPVWQELRQNTYEQDGAELDVDFETWYRAVLEYLLAYGILSPSGAERYGAGWLEDIVSDVDTIDRVCWLEAEITIPAGDSVTLSASMTKEASYDFYCAHTENQGVKGYDLVTALGSTLDFTGQTASLVNTENIEIVRQNFGFDLEAGITEVALDPAEPHYYLEIRARNG